MVSTTNCILSAKQCSTVGPESPCSSGTFRPQPHSHGHNQVAFQPLLRGSSSTWQTVHHKLARGLIPSSVTSTANGIWLQPTPLQSVFTHLLIQKIGSPFRLSPLPLFMLPLPSLLQHLPAFGTLHVCTDPHSLRR